MIASLVPPISFPLELKKKGGREKGGGRESRGSPKLFFFKEKKKKVSVEECEWDGNRGRTLSFEALTDLSTFGALFLAFS